MDDFFLNTVGSWVIAFLGKYPLFATVVVIIGFLRMIMKPVMTILQAYVKLTPYDSDDKWLESFEQSKSYKLVVYLMDWVLSVKMPEKSKAETIDLPK
jgi:uncharacterized membrane protein required for colicin V production